jgi:hypothetical protein
LAIFDEDYMKESSLVDTLEIILGEDQIEADGIISILTKLSNRLHGEDNDSAHFEIDERNTLVEALLGIQNEFRDNFDVVLKTFTKPENQESITDILARYLSKEIKPENLTEKIRELIENQQ